MKRTFQPSNKVKKDVMVLGQECQHKVVKKSLPEEDKKEESPLTLV